MNENSRQRSRIQPFLETTTNKRLAVPAKPASPGLQIALLFRLGTIVKNSKTGNASDRRAHRRIASSELPAPAFIRIPNRPAISLVDLSPGGALLDLPFQLRPESRVTLELSTSADRLAVPFHLLRCWVAELKGGVRYHAAGAFEQTLNLPASLAGGLATAASDRLIATLEGFLRSSRAADASARGAHFSEMLGQVVAGLRQGEGADRLSAQIKAHLAQLFPALAITQASASLLRDVSTSARFFGLEFRSSTNLTSADRRFLRAGAQLITLIDKDAGLPRPRKRRLR